MTSDDPGPPGAAHAPSRNSASIHARPPLPDCPDKMWLASVLHGISDGIPARAAPERRTVVTRRWPIWTDADLAVPPFPSFRVHPDVCLACDRLTPFEVRRHWHGLGRGALGQLSRLVTCQDVSSILCSSSTRCISSTSTEGTAILSSHRSRSSSSSTARRIYRPYALMFPRRNRQCARGSFRGLRREFRRKLPRVAAKQDMMFGAASGLASGTPAVGRPGANAGDGGQT